MQRLRSIIYARCVIPKKPDRRGCFLLGLRSSPIIAADTFEKRTGRSPRVAVETVAILSPGDMGHAVGRALREGGLDVITCLEGRSARTRRLSGEAGIRSVPTLNVLVSEADLVLSILAPAEAVGLASQVAEALGATARGTTFADCNAVSPQTSKAMADIITGAGGRYVDAGIVGLPPGRDVPRLYVSGPHAELMSELDGKGLSVRSVGDAIGAASGVKMCYAALTKGTWGLYVALLTAAEAMGLSAAVMRELSESQPEAVERMRRAVPGLPAKAARWVGEMEEIAATFDHLGVTPLFHQGAADVYRLLGDTPFADERAETVDESRTLEETISALARLLPSRVGDGA